jgi:hypothetical protein
LNSHLAILAKSIIEIATDSTIGETTFARRVSQLILKIRMDGKRGNPNTGESLTAPPSTNEILGWPGLWSQARFTAPTTQRRRRQENEHNPFEKTKCHSQRFKGSSQLNRIEVKSLISEALLAGKKPDNSFTRDSFDPEFIEKFIMRVIEEAR